MSIQGSPQASSEGAGCNAVKVGMPESSVTDRRVRLRPLRLGRAERIAPVPTRHEPATAPIPETQVGRRAVRRDTLYRRSLGLADVIAALTAFELAAVLTEDTHPRAATML